MSSGAGVEGHAMENLRVGSRSGSLAGAPEKAAATSRHFCLAPVCLLSRLPMGMKPLDIFSVYWLQLSQHAVPHQC